MHWSMMPSIAIEGLWVANPEWASGEYLARAESAVLQFDIPALLQRRLDGNGHAGDRALRVFCATPG